MEQLKCVDERRNSRGSNQIVCGVGSQDKFDAALGSWWTGGSVGVNFDGVKSSVRAWGRW